LDGVGMLEMAFAAFEGKTLRRTNAAVQKKAQCIMVYNYKI